MSDVIPLAECEERRVYLLKSRNLAFGVFAKDRQGFIGIREKLGARYLFMEYHVEAPAFNTARPLKALDVFVKPPIRLQEWLATVCQYCGLPVEWTGPPAPAPWRHLMETDCPKASPGSPPNRPLFDLLHEVEHGHTDEG